MDTCKHIINRLPYHLVEEILDIMPEWDFLFQCFLDDEIYNDIDEFFEPDKYQPTGETESYTAVAADKDDFLIEFRLHLNNDDLHKIDEENLNLLFPEPLKKYISTYHYDSFTVYVVRLDFFEHYGERFVYNYVCKYVYPKDVCDGCDGINEPIEDTVLSHLATHWSPSGLQDALGDE